MSNINRNKLIIFDLDGTFFDTFADIYNALKTLLLKHNYPIPTEDQARSFVGDGLKKFLARSINVENTKDLPEIFYNDFIYIYANNLVIDTKPYPYMIELANKLYNDKHILAVVSNKSEVFVKAIYKHFELDDKFSFLAGGDTFEEKKPSPLPILTIANDLGFKDRMNDVIMIGDSDNDILSAKYAGAKSIFCTFGYSENLKAPADFTVNSADEIYSLI